jgi:hypothetical protein
VLCIAAKADWQAPISTGRQAHGQRRLVNASSRNGAVRTATEEAAVGQEAAASGDGQRAQQRAEPVRRNIGRSPVDRSGEAGRSFRNPEPTA